MNNSRFLTTFFFLGTFSCGPYSQKIPFKNKTPTLKIKMCNSQEILFVPRICLYTIINQA